MRLDVNPNEPRYVRKGVQVRKNDSINLTRDEFTKKAFGLHRRKLAEVRATPEGAAHPVHGYKRPLTEKLKAVINERRRLALVREARRAYQKRGNEWKRKRETARKTGRPKVAWPNFKEHIDQAIGPDTAVAITSRELGGARTRIEDGNWHALIDTLKDQEGENSAIVKLLRSSGRVVEGGVWVVD